MLLFLLSIASCLNSLGGRTWVADNRDAAASDQNAGLTSLGGRTWVVDNRDAAASDQNAGTAEAPFLTVSKAAETASEGDTVQVHPGIYRERIAPVASGVKYFATAVASASASHADQEALLVASHDHAVPRVATLRGSNAVNASEWVKHPTEDGLW